MIKFQSTGGSSGLRPALGVRSPGDRKVRNIPTKAASKRLLGLLGLPPSPFVELAKAERSIR